MAYGYLSIEYQAVKNEKSKRKSEKSALDQPDFNLLE